MIERSFDLPSLTEIDKLHRKYAPSREAYELVHTHSRIVGDIALQLAAKSMVPIDAELAEVGSLLHDIGVYTLLDEHARRVPGTSYITHGVVGERILRDEGLPEPLTRFASHHTGAGLTREDIVARSLPLPHADFLPETDEEELVMYADKFHSKRHPPVFNSFNAYARHVRAYGQDNVTRFERMGWKFDVPELGALALKYGHQIVE